MTEKTILNLDPATDGRKLVHVVNLDDTTETPQGSSQKLSVGTQNMFAQAVNNGQTTSIGATGTYEHINVDSALVQVKASHWDTFAGRIRFIGVGFTGVIRATVEVLVPPGSPTNKFYDIRGAVNTNVTGIFPTLYDMVPGGYRQVSLEFRVANLSNGDLIDCRIRQLSGAVDQNPIISMLTYEAIED